MKRTVLVALITLALQLPTDALAGPRNGVRPKPKVQTRQQHRVRPAIKRAPRRARVNKPVKRQQYKLRDLKSSLFRGTPAARKDNLAHGSYYTRKEIRTRIYKARASDHGRKHLKARSEAEAKQFSTKAAQYLPGVNNKNLERTALQKGTLIRRPGGDVWAIYRAPRAVGYDGGEKTHWLRAELSSGTIHGHPMKLSRVLKYLKDAK